MEDLYAEIGRLTTQRTWLKKKPRELSRAERLTWIERDGSELPLTVRADVLGLSRRSLYYQPKGPSPEEGPIKHRIDEIYTEMPAYGSRRMTAQLRPLLRGKTGDLHALVYWDFRSSMTGVLSTGNPRKARSHTYQ